MQSKDPFFVNMNFIFLENCTLEMIAEFAYTQTSRYLYRKASFLSRFGTKTLASNCTLDAVSDFYGREGK